MFKSALINRLLQLRVSTCVGAILCVIAVLQFFTSYGVYNYSHLAPEVIDSQLFKQITPKLHIHKTKPDCNYDEILNNKETVDPWEVPKKIEHFSAKGVDNGSFVPAHCNPLFSVAVLVTYRNRQKQLDVFLPYMHNFLRKQNIHYKFPREMSRYTMLMHRPEPKNSQRYNIIAENEQKAGVDGLSAMPYHHTRVKNHKMFTLIQVNL